jgi:hypothetical protein
VSRRAFPINNPARAWGAPRSLRGRLLRPQGSLSRSLRDGLRPSLTPETSAAPWGRAVGRSEPAPAVRTAHQQDHKNPKITTSEVSTVRGYCHPSAPAPRLPNTWQQYDTSAAGSQWYATGATGSLINCTLASPCSFDALKAAMPDAVITRSLGFSMDTAFIGAIDGLQVNNTVYDFGPLGARKIAVGP